MRTVNGISGLAAECFYYIQFRTDAQPDDLKRAFKDFGGGYETKGVFELNTSNHTIHFDYNYTQKL